MAIEHRALVLRRIAIISIKGQLPSFMSVDVCYGSEADIFTCARACPLSPHKRTFSTSHSMSAKCHLQTYGHTQGFRGVWVFFFDNVPALYSRIAAEYQVYYSEIS